jgi:hypothetical protein
MAKIKSKVSQSSEQNIVQNASQNEQQTFQNKEKVVQRAEPRYPVWPTSKPGSPSTLLPAGTHPINAFRPEQVTPIGSNQEVGLSNALDTLGKRKQRL